MKGSAMQVIFECNDTRLGEAEFSVMPRPGDIVGLCLVPGFHRMSDGSLAPIGDALFKVEAMSFQAFNSIRVEEWMTTLWTRGKDAFAILEVSAVDEQTQAYIERVKAQESKE